MSTVMPFVREPVENFHLIHHDIVDYSHEYSPGQVLKASSSVLTELYSDDSNSSAKNEEPVEFVYNNKKSCLFLLDQFQPTMNNINDIEDIVRKDRCCQFYLWQQSSFYDKAKIDVNAWELRWFTFSNDQIISLRHRRDINDDGGDKFMLPLITKLDMDPSRLLIKITTIRRECKSVGCFILF